MICHGSTAVMSVLVALTCCPSAARSPPRMALSQSSRSWSLKPTGRLNSCWARRHARTPGALGERRDSDDHVFTAPQGGTLRIVAFRNRIWRPATDAAGLAGLRIHDLRHTAVALWIAAGASPKEVAARAGHTSVSFTLDRYGHLYPESDAMLRDRLEAMHATVRPAGGVVIQFPQ